MPKQFDGKTRICGFYTTFDRPEVEKLRGHSGCDPREKSEVVEEKIMTREEIKAILKDISDEQVNSILDLNSRDIGKVKGLSLIHI